MKFRPQYVLIVALLLCGAARGQSDRQADALNRALFQSTDTLQLTLEANFGDVTHDRNPESDKVFPGVIRLGSGSEALQIPVQLSARGNLRRKNCEFIPLRIAFPKEASKGTFFEMRGSALKLVTHCENSAEFEQYILKEYLAYRLSNIITGRSFRARLARVNYVDSEKKKSITTRYAIFLEDDDDVARRLDGKVLDKGLQFNQLHPVAVVEMNLFEYMIGNTDYSTYMLHNVKIVQTAVGLSYPIPYDFDVSGLVSVPYAIPDPRLMIKSLTERVYRGPCRTQQQMEPFLQIFRSKKTDLLAAVDAVPDLNSRNRHEATAFLNGFFTTIDKPASVKSNIIKRCLKTTN